MKRELVEILSCPECGSGLEVVDEREADGEVESGRLQCRQGRHSFPIVSFIPRFVPADDYTTSFGLQWNQFRTTQLDSTLGFPLSRRRVFQTSGWAPGSLRDRLVLDAGCGAGRFLEVVLDKGARVVALDRSSAVDACLSSFGLHPRLHLVQGDILSLPFAPARFDDVYCLGVLQHTPSPRDAFLALARQVRGGGRIAVDVYPRRPTDLLWPKYWLRPLTKRVPPSWLLRGLQRAVPPALRLSTALGRLPAVGSKLRYAVPVANYEGLYPMTREQLDELSLLDTFDMLAAAHDHPQTAGALRSWFAEAGMTEVEILRLGVLVGRGVKPEGDGAGHA